LISLAELFSRIISSSSESETPRTDDPKTEDEERTTLKPPESPLIREVHGTKTLHIKIWQSENLTEEKGRVPEQTIAHNLATALEHSFINYRIDFGLETQHPPDEDVRGDTPGWWREKREDGEIDEAKNSNLLLLNHIGGGGTYGDSAVVGCGQIDQYTPHQRYGRGGAHGNIHAALHEVGHNEDLAHDMDEDQPGNQHTGLGWNEGGEWYYTPTNAGNDTNNFCGEKIPKRVEQSPVYVHEYAPCFRESIDVK